MKIKNFKQFLNEKMMDDVENVQDTEISDEFVQDEFVQDEFVQDELNDKISELDEEQPEEIQDVIEIKYNKRLDEWAIEGEFDLPSDFELFYDWIIDEEHDKSNSVSIKEEGDEVTFYLPEDLYVEYMEEIEKGFEDEVIEDETDYNNDIDPDDIDEDDDDF